MEVQLLAIQAK
uniref:Uncharacterized protein n=1 Tax=Musa acuminata subsp. malaccensis TaxID=214687 RepID=A0A804I6V0_MUSAM